MSSWQVERQLELEEEALYEAYERGKITNEQLQKDLRELHREYRAAAEEAAFDAYERELSNW